MNKTWGTEKVKAIHNTLMISHLNSLYFIFEASSSAHSREKQVQIQDSNRANGGSVAVVLFCGNTFMSR